MTAQIKVRATGEHGEHARLTHGVFFGQFQRETEAGGFSLAHISADPRTDVQRHTHDAAHFIFVTRGVYVTTAKGPPAALIYNPPGTTHRDRFQSRPDGTFYGRFLSISIAPERMKNLQLAERPTTIAAGSSLATRLISELECWEPLSKLVAEGICLELAAHAARNAPCGERTAPRWLSIAREMLHEEEVSVSVGDVAAACGVHPVHLARTFRRFFGCSPGESLRRSRVEHAAALIRRGSLPLSEIALRSGFADQSHMSRAFQSALAMTPAAFRRQCCVPSR